MKNHYFYFKSKHKVIRLGLFLVISLLLMFNLVEIKAEPIIPKVAIVSLEHYPFAEGDNNEFYISSKNYSGQVQYQLFYINERTMDTWQLFNNSDMNNGWTSYIDAQEPMKVNISNLKLKADKYRFAIRVRRVGVKGVYQNKYGDYDDAYPFELEVCKKSPINLNGDLRIDKAEFNQNENLTIDGIDNVPLTAEYKLHLFDVKNSKWITNLTDYNINIDRSLNKIPVGTYIADIWVKDINSNKKYDGWKLKVIEITKGISDSNNNDSKQLNNKNYGFSNPAPLNTSQVVECSDILQSYKAEMTVKEIIRGQEAWEKIENANMFNSEPKEGYEYILAKVNFKLLDINDGEQYQLNSAVHIKLVSNQGKEYDYTSAVCSDPQLTCELYEGASNEGWAAYLVRKDDLQPKLVFGRDYNGKGGIWFKAYKDDNSIIVDNGNNKPIPTPTKPEQPNNKNYGFSNPAPLNTSQVVECSDILQSYKAEMTVKEIIRGQEAWEKIEDANMFNSEPKEGYEYILAKINFKLLDINDGEQYQLNSAVHIKLVSNQGKEYDYASVVCPDPELTCELYEAASNEGWAVYLVRKDDLQPKLVFGRDYNGKGGIWFKAYND